MGVPLPVYLRILPPALLKSVKLNINCCLNVALMSFQEKIVDVLSERIQNIGFQA